MKCFFYVAILIIICNTVDAQSLAINTTGATANTSAILDVSSTTKGVLVSRMTKAQKNAIATPANGLLVYQGAPDSVGFHYYNGSQWIWLNPSGGASNDWSLTGNTGTDTAVNFMGTTNNMPLRFKQNNLMVGQWNINNGTYFLGEWAGRSNTTGSHNIGIGDSSLYSNTSSIGNIAVGYRALRRNTAAGHNTAIGYQSLYSNTGSDNTAIGYNALSSNTTGTVNTAIGSEVLQLNTIGYGNTAVGPSSLFANTTGNSNSAFGGSALGSNISGTHNLALGVNSLLLNESGNRNIALSTASLYNNFDGNNNIGIGYFSLFSNASGNYNVAIGDSAAHSSTNLSHLVAIGSKALFANTSGTNLTAVGDSALFSNTTGYKNIALGNSALVKNTTGFQNIAMGYSTLQKNVTGFANIAIGDSALSANTTNWNIAIGRSALLETTTGDKNMAIGQSALANNLTGTNNVAIGYASQSGSSGSGTNNKNNTSLGHRTLWSVNGYSNTAIGGDAMGRPTTPYTVNNTVAVGDSVLFNITTGASNNTAVGTKALYSNSSGRTNTAIGARALYNNTTGSYNVAIGDSAAYNSNLSGIVALGSRALFSNTTGTNNTAIGIGSLYNNVNGGFNVANGANALASNIAGNENVADGYASLMFGSGSGNTGVGNESLNFRVGDDNVAIGNRAGADNSLSSGNNNVYVGRAAGYNSAGNNNVYLGSNNGFNSIGNSNVFIGDEVGNGFTGSNILMIDNQSAGLPLIFGNFATDLLRINGTLNINSQYSFPMVDGTANQVLYTNGSGAVNWGNALITANNGLNVSTAIVKLGGTLLDSTTITQGSRSMVFDLNGTGDFYVRKNTTEDALMIKNNGFVGLNTSDPLYRLHIINTSGGNGPFGRGIVIENSNTGSNGEASIAFKNNGPGSVAANSAWMSGLNNTTNYVLAYGDSLKATNVKMKLDTLGNVSIGNQGAAAQSKLDVNGSFGNAIRSITADYTTDGDDHTIIIATSVGATPLTVTLPAATTCDRREYTIVNRNGSIKTITSYSDFSGTSTALPANASITLQSNGTNWFRIR